MSKGANTAVVMSTSNKVIEERFHFHTETETIAGVGAHFFHATTSYFHFCIYFPLSVFTSTAISREILVYPHWSTIQVQ